MTGPDFDHFCQLALTRSGLVLTPEKAYLVLSRLEPVAKRNGINDVPTLLARLRQSAPEPLVRACVEAMATHESLFFRDVSPFDCLADVFAAGRHEAPRPWKVWSAACSSGQEAYSIAMLALEQAGRMGGRPVDIFGTDIAEGIIDKARKGQFSDFEVQRGLSPERLARWMHRTGDGWQVSPALKAMTRFETHNLLQAAPTSGPFDVVFCRNVLIYFDVQRKAQALHNIAKAMAPGGVLFLGAADSIAGLCDAFQPEPGRRGVFRMGEAAALARTA